MSVRNQLKLLVGGLNARRAGHSASPHSATREFFDRSRLVAVLIFVATVTAIVLISSAGLTTLNVPVLPNQLATARVAAATAFTYQSLEQTSAASDQLINRLPPVYRLDLEASRRFESAARELLAGLDAYERDHPANALVLGNRAEDAFRLSMIGAEGDMRVFWSNGLVGSITTLALILLFWSLIAAGIKKMQGARNGLKHSG